MEAIYAHEVFESTKEPKIALCGPSPRSKEVKSWRPEALAIFLQKGFKGHVYVPEPRSGEWQSDLIAQAFWENKMLQNADVILFWMPRDMKTMPALTSNVEFGMWVKSGKCVLGVPPTAEHCGYIKYHAKLNNVPQSKTLEHTIELAIEHADKIIKIKNDNRRGGDQHLLLSDEQAIVFSEWMAKQGN